MTVPLSASPCVRGNGSVRIGQSSRSGAAACEWENPSVPRRQYQVHLEFPIPARLEREDRIDVLVALSKALDAIADDMGPASAIHRDEFGVTLSLDAESSAWAIARSVGVVQLAGQQVLGEPVTIRCTSVIESGSALART